MALQLPDREVFTSLAGHHHSYIYIKPTDDKPTLLLLHGFPSTAADWLYQIKHFSSAGYGILAPDLLGYGASSKPLGVQSYRLRYLADEVVQLLDHVGLTQVVGIGHDTGATLLSRLAAYHPSRISAVVLLAVGPPPLGTPFDVDAINQMTKQVLGFELLGYIPWLAGGEAQATLEQHAESAMSLVFCENHAVWHEWFHPLGKMRQFVSEDRRVAIGSWYTAELQQAHLAAFGTQDGYKGATTWYEMWMGNHFAPDEAGFENVKLAGRVLLVVPEASASQQEALLASWAPGLQTARLDAGHWLHLEWAKETNGLISEFLLSQ